MVKLGDVSMEIYFKEAGNKTGETIVFIHGGGISGWMWNKQLEYFKDYHCIVPDLPEHGNSMNAGEISIKESVNLIADIIKKHANGGRAHVVGHSLGAKVVVELLSTYPEIIDHAVIASALFRQIPIMKMTHKLFIYRLTVSMLKINWLLDLQVKQFKLPDRESEKNLKEDFRKMTADMLYRVYDELYQNLILPKGLDRAKVPALVIAGEKELNAMKQSVRDIVDELPNSKGILIKKGLHTYPMVMYDTFNEIVSSWLKNESIDNISVIRL